MRLRLAFWAKLLRMAPTRWPRRLYEVGRRSMSPWCRETRDLLCELDLGHSCDEQCAPQGWEVELESKVHDWQIRHWSNEVESSPKLILYVRLGPVFGPHDYLGEPV